MSTLIERINEQIDGAERCIQSPQLRLLADCRAALVELNKRPWIDGEDVVQGEHEADTGLIGKTLEAFAREKARADAAEASLQKMTRERDDWEKQQTDAADRAQRAESRAQMALAERDVKASRLTRKEIEAKALRTERDQALSALAAFQRWPTVYVFALEMMRKLDEHAPKKGGREGWKNDDPKALLRRIGEETTELWYALGHRRVAIAGETADVANMAMMVADAAGALTEVDAAALSATKHDPVGKATKAVERAVESASAKRLGLAWSMGYRRGSGLDERDVTADREADIASLLDIELLKGGG